MTLIARHIKGLMLISGGLTATMLYAAIAPAAALQSTFGESLSGPVAELVVRNWGVLIALVGAMLVHGALNPSTRRLALVTAIVSKSMFVSLVLSNGALYLAHGAGTAVVIDTIMVVVFAVYLVSSVETTPALRKSEVA